jgi:hypothetical protein
MRIALDYDFTFSEDPDAWCAAMAAMIERGHEIIGVTARHPDHNADMHDSYFRLCTEVYFTAGEFKRKYMNEVEKIIVHVWIDDAPEMISQPIPILCTAKG